MMSTPVRTHKSLPCTPYSWNLILFHNSSSRSYRVDSEVCLSNQFYLPTSKRASLLTAVALKHTHPRLKEPACSRQLCSLLGFLFCLWFCCSPRCPASRSQQDFEVLSSFVPYSQAVIQTCQFPYIKPSTSALHLDFWNNVLIICFVKLCIFIMNLSNDIAKHKEERKA